MTDMMRLAAPRTDFVAYHSPRLQGTYHHVPDGRMTGVVLSDGEVVWASLPTPSVLDAIYEAYWALSRVREASR